MCGGIAEYFDIDPTLIRLAWILFTACAGNLSVGHYKFAISALKKIILLELQCIYKVFFLNF